MNCGEQLFWQGQVYCVAWAVSSLLLGVLGVGFAWVFLARGITLPPASFHRLPRVDSAHAAGQSQSRLCLPHTGTRQGAGRAGAGSQVRGLCVSGLV